MTSLGAATMADLPQLLLFFLMIIAIIVILIMIILIIQIMIILIPPGVATMVDSLQLLFHPSWPQLDLSLLFCALTAVMWQLWMCWRRLGRTANHSPTSPWPTATFSNRLISRPWPLWSI